MVQFSENISSSTPQSTPLLPDAYWVALNNETVVGTVGVFVRSDYVILKRMMVKKEFRGEAVGLSTQLLQTAINWTLSSNISTIYLGTMAQFKAAQGFYTKHGFEQVSEQALPGDFDINPVDSLFFRLEYKSP